MKINPIGHVRIQLPAKEHRQLRLAAAHAGKSITSFTRDAALQAACKVLGKNGLLQHP